MNTLSATLKIIAIFFNAIMLLMLVLLCIQNPPEGNTPMVVIVFLLPLTNLFMLMPSRKFLTGIRGGVFSVISVLSSILMLLFIVFSIAQSGLPDPAGLRLLALLWLITPLVTIPAALLQWASLKGNTPPG